MIVVISLADWHAAKPAFVQQDLTYCIRGISIPDKNIQLIPPQYSRRESVYHIMFADEKEASWFVLSCGGKIIS